MSFYKFDEDDLFTNTIEAYPQYRFYTQSGSIYINDMPHLVGANTDNNIGVPKGFVSLYEYNIDRPFILSLLKTDTETRLKQYQRKHIMQRCCSEKHPQAPTASQQVYHEIIIARQQEPESMHYRIH